MFGDLALNTGNTRVGNSGALGIGSGSSASGSGISIAISVGSGTDIRGVVSVTAEDSSGAARGDASIVSGLSLTSRGGSLTLVLGDGNTRGGAETIDGSSGSMALGSSLAGPQAWEALPYPQAMQEQQACLVIY